MIDKAILRYIPGGKTAAIKEAYKVEGKGYYIELKIGWSAEGERSISEANIRELRKKIGKIQKENNTDNPLAIYRQKRGFSQTQLARCSGVPVWNIQRYEQDSEQLNGATGHYLYKLAKALEIPMEALIKSE